MLQNRYAYLGGDIDRVVIGAVGGPAGANDTWTDRQVVFGLVAWAEGAAARFPDSLIGEVERVDHLPGRTHRVRELVVGDVAG
ncbi:hypothetical protein [Brevibacterium litoralis]|uniref:hypothetical protein n=1 Tax=Brevibacterium litoralis TaxID=3138935 RepID=UPI0032EEB7B0